MMLEVKDIHTFYGLSQILFEVSLRMDRQEVVCLLGRNGVGKTTTLRSVMGLTPARRGKITFKDVDITKWPSYQIAQFGMGFVPEDRRIFPDLSVRENLEVAQKKSIDQRDIWTLERVYEFFPVLRKLESRVGGYLSGGEQQMLTIGRTLMGNPELLLLDEPSEGLSPLVVKEVGRQVKRLKENGMSILLCEQNARFAMDLSDRAYILDKGRVRFEGSIKELRENREVAHTHLAV